MVDDSLRLQAYTFLVAPLLFHMGSLIPLRVMLKPSPSIVLLTGIQLLWQPMPDPGSGAWWLTCPVFVIAVLLVVWAISTITKRWQSPRPVLSPRWPTDTVTVTAVALFVVQSLAISSYGLNLPMAILGLVCTTIAVNLAEDSATARSRISVGNDATIAEGKPPTPDWRAGPPAPPR
ncbi:hypothetical protein [Brevibacterium linens]|uniref:hypothetical protein n=1 Tax=Brevibacterium linens TaxID=1703 RepID=UPI000FCA5DC4|nr:hypothetical protein [Brevibacterium linens]AZU00116.1 hypothetical protein CXR29_04805 [Brevibacterium linens]